MIKLYLWRLNLLQRVLGDLKGVLYHTLTEITVFRED